MAKIKPPPGLVQRTDNLWERLWKRISRFLASFGRARVAQIVFCFLIVVGYSVLLSSGRLIRFENIVLDYFFRTRPAIATHSEITLIEISEDSLQAIGRWPWARQYHAVLTHLLNQWGARAIVFDMIFPEKNTDFDDQAFQEAIAKAGNVYFPVVLEKTKSKKQMWVHSLPILERSAKGLGHINIEPDQDGTLRRICPRIHDRSETYPHLALRVAYQLMGEALPSGDEWPFPLDDNGNFFINWAGKWKGTFTHYSYWDLIRSFEAVENGRRPVIAPSDIEGKICLIGLTATGHADIKASPIESAYPALGVHANIINSLLTWQFIDPLPLAGNIFFIIFVGIIAMFLFVPFRNVTSIITGLCLLFGWWIFCFVMFWKEGLWIYALQPSLLVISLFIFSSIWTQLVVSKESHKLFQMAIRDGLTGLYVIRHFRMIMRGVCERAKETGSPFSVILLDIDDFKKINDAYGHQAGDMVLQITAQVVRSSIRILRDTHKRDYAARYGGEELIVLLQNTDLINAAFQVAERIRTGVQQFGYRWNDQKIDVTVSLGVATFHFGEDNPEKIIRRADEALYRAKREGKNRVCLEEKVKEDKP
ncbi:MAG: CHASE2 domain-containing protein [Candidatus Omnitrophica bacterium]|nr:CHASE2 domain-containing protein [Candidatus Omnitrophota bacterium]